VSSVVVLDLKAPEHEAADLDRGLRLAAEALTRPRKMLRNAFRTDIDSTQIEAAGLDASARPGTVPLEGWVRLARRA
jgi:16S rRNA A1518/A1519 N6-dimethyltransferase RsmA/KsgA/DIM1 with predicted DNA glycosylase/AP lyase activity